MAVHQRGRVRRVRRRHPQRRQVVTQRVAERAARRRFGVLPGQRQDALARRALWFVKNLLIGSQYTCDITLASGCLQVTSHPLWKHHGLLQQGQEHED